MTITPWWTRRSKLVVALAGLCSLAGCMPMKRALRPSLEPAPSKLQTAVAVDREGSHIMVGSFTGKFRIAGTELESAGGTDIFVAKLTKAGAPAFAPLRFGGAGDDAATGVAVDEDGSIVIGGTFQGQATFGDQTVTAQVRHLRQRAVFVARLDPAGKVSWIRQVGFANAATQVSVAIGPDRNIFVGASGVGSIGKDGAAIQLAGQSIFLDVLAPSGASANVPIPKFQALSARVTCQHSPCQQGGPLNPLCDWCVAHICGLDSYCCGIAWDAQCVSEVWTMCGQRCDCDAKCTVGPPINAYACPCVGELCSHDDYCTTVEWDATCVSEVPTYCGVTCR